MAYNRRPPYTKTVMTDAERAYYDARIRDLFPPLEPMPVNTSMPQLYSYASFEPERRFHRLRHERMAGK